MKTKPELELADLKLIAAAAEAEALKNHWAVTIAIVDDGGHLLRPPFPPTSRRPRRTRPRWGGARARATRM